MVRVKVWGDLACFSRPELKVERVSYPLITPSAARGVLEAIHWKPEFRWSLRRIGVIRMGTPTTLLRNEISQRQGSNPLVIERVRQQRSSLVLKDVCYLLEADIVPREHIDAASREAVLNKHRAIFERRISKGQCFQQPYLGIREFTAFFAAPDEQDEPDSGLNLDVGQMLFDVAFVHGGREDFTFRTHGVNGSDVVSGHARAVYFSPRVKAGWLTVPRELYDRVWSLEGGDRVPGAS